MNKILLCSLLCGFGISTCPMHTEYLPQTVEPQFVNYASVVIQEEKTCIDKEKEPATYVYTTTNLNVRTTPSINSDIVETLPPNTKLEWIVIINNEWVGISVNEHTYYVNAEYVTEEEPEEIITLESLEPTQYSIGKDEEKITFQDCLGEYTLTAYCACEKCCGKWSKYKKTASGTTPKEGRTVACVSLDFGTIININGEDYIVEDRGRLKDNQIDIYFESHEEAREFGRQKGTVYLIEKAEEDK